MSNDYTNYYMSGFREWDENKSYNRYDDPDLLRMSNESFVNQLTYGNLKKDGVKVLFEKKVLNEYQIDYAQRFFEDENFF